MSHCNALLNRFNQNNALVNLGKLLQFGWGITDVKHRTIQVEDKNGRHTGKQRSNYYFQLDEENYIYAYKEEHRFLMKYHTYSAHMNLHTDQAFYSMSCDGNSAKALYNMLVREQKLKKR